MTKREFIMHELSITEAILSSALDEAKKNNATRIISISLDMGELSSVVPECVQEYFDMLSEGTIAHDALLNFNLIRSLLKCRCCDNEFHMEHMRLRCPKCNSQNVDIIKGKEFNIRQLEIEQED